MVDTTNYYDNLKHYIPGASTAITKIVLGYPIDTLKVRHQLNLKSTLNPHHYYKGCSIPLVSSIVKRSLQLTLYESFKDTSTYYAGGMSGLVTSIVMNPFTIVKVNLQSNKYKTIRDVLSNYKQIQKGFYINIIRDTLFSTYYLGTYGYLRNKLPDTPLYHSLSGMVAGSTQWLFLIPFDYIRTNIQCNVNHVTLLKTVSKSPLVLWKGTQYMILKSLPVNLVTMVIYEYLKKNL